MLKILKENFIESDCSGIGPKISCLLPITKSIKLLSLGAYNVCVFLTNIIIKLSALVVMIFKGLGTRRDLRLIGTLNVAIY